MKRLSLLALGVALPAMAWAQNVPPIQPDNAAGVVQASSSSQAAASASVPSDNQSGGKQAETIPDGMPPAMPRILAPERPLSRKAAVAARVANRWRLGVIRPSMGSDGVLRFPFGRGEPAVVCAPLHVCDITLQPGEIVVGVPHVGNSVGWLVEPAISGVGKQRTTHVLVKPTDTGLDSNIVIATDRHTYSIQLLSQTHQYMPRVAFSYDGEDGATGWGQSYATALNAGTRSVCDQQPVVPPTAFRISVADGRPGWVPTQAYAVQTPVGMKTCIEFRADIGSTNLPALLLLGNDGTWFTSPTKLPVNYMYLQRQFVVDELIDRAELVNGVEGERQRVKITREAVR